MAAYDAQKKYKKNLEALTTQIEERERRINAQEAEITIYHKKIKSLEKQLETIDHKKADKKVKPPKATEEESTIFSLSQQLLQVQLERDHQQGSNMAVKKTLVLLKHEI